MIFIQDNKNLNESNFGKQKNMELTKEEFVNFFEKNLNESNFGKQKNMELTKEEFVNFFENNLNDNGKSTVLEWYADVRRQIEMEPVEQEIYKLSESKSKPLKEENSNNINFNNLANKELKKFPSNENEKEITELLNELRKINQKKYEDENKTSGEKLKFVLDYVYGHLDKPRKKQIFSTDYTYRQELCFLLNPELNYLENKEDKCAKWSVNPWYVDVLIGLLAATCTGLVWLIFGWAKDKKKVEDINSKVYEPKGEFDTGKDRDTGFDIFIGVLSVLVSILFVLSIIFAWSVAAQAILGIIFALQAVIGIVSVFNYEKDEICRRKGNNAIGLQEMKIANAIQTRLKITSFLQTTPKKENKIENNSLFHKYMHHKTSGFSNSGNIATNEANLDYQSNTFEK